MDGWMVVLDVEMFPERSLSVKTDGLKDNHLVRLKASGCRFFVPTIPRKDDPCGRSQELKRGGNVAGFDAVLVILCRTLTQCRTLRNARLNATADGLPSRNSRCVNVYVDACTVARVFLSYTLLFSSVSKATTGPT
ncbi:hypothetical protein AMELA_G00245710 [Ameiurus melas]|uniref:Uncharacterized protein n=1 Tax=Ameiurus melas TaxID=219545 RepID=A0A7J5ZWN0_AMEME|nr:hypothetical protein AMELA_G00245710 [Ameiurus melas]